MSDYPKLKMSNDKKLLVWFETPHTGRVVWSEKNIYSINDFFSDWDDEYFNDFDPTQPPAQVKKKEHGNKKQIIDAAETIMASFAWKDMNEGYDYWDKVHDALHRIAEEGR